MLLSVWGKATVYTGVQLDLAMALQHHGGAISEDSETKVKQNKVLCFESFKGLQSFVASKNSLNLKTLKTKE